MAAGAWPVRFNNRLHTLVIIIMLHLAWSLRLTPIYEYMSRTKQMEEDVGVEMTDGGRAYLQLPENLRLAAGLEVLQSLGPEAVILVQGALATRGADESMTTQEPEHESSPVVLRPVQRGKCSFCAACRRVPLENLSQWGFTVNSPTCGSSKADESARLDKAFRKFFFSILQK